MQTHAYQKLLMAQLARTSPALVQRLEVRPPPLAPLLAMRLAVPLTAQ